VGGLLILELIFTAIMLRASHVQRERERKRERDKKKERVGGSVVGLLLFIFRLLCITSTHRRSLIFRD
jgi:hypothetical protein